MKETKIYVSATQAKKIHKINADHTANWAESIFNTGHVTAHTPYEANLIIDWLNDQKKDIYFTVKRNPKKKNILKGGKGDALTVDDVDQNELRMGMMIEMEHTDDKWIALEIVLDHLAEFPDYYTRLVIMENSAKKKIKSNPTKPNEDLIDFVMSVIDSDEYEAKAVATILIEKYDLKFPFSDEDPKKEAKEEKLANIIIKTLDDLPPMLPPMPEPKNKFLKKFDDYRYDYFQPKVRNMNNYIQDIKFKVEREDNGYWYIDEIEGSSPDEAVENYFEWYDLDRSFLKSNPEEKKSVGKKVYTSGNMFYETVWPNGQSEGYMYELRGLEGAIETLVAKIGADRYIKLEGKEKTEKQAIDKFYDYITQQKLKSNPRKTYSDYNYYSINNDGEIISGWSYKQDALDDKKESALEERGIYEVKKIAHHSRADKEAVKRFNERCNYKGNKPISEDW